MSETRFWGTPRSSHDCGREGKFGAGSADGARERVVTAAQGDLPDGDPVPP